MEITVTRVWLRDTKATLMGGFEMANMLEVRRQLHKAGFTNNYWGWSAIRQLPSLLDSDEVIERVATGMYVGGHAIVLATNKRMLILDKKPMSFRAEDIHYEMISEIEHYLGPLTAKLRIHCLSNDFEITSLRYSNIQSFAIYVDQKVNQTRLNMSNVNAWSQMLGQGSPGPRRVGTTPADYQASRGIISRE